MLFTFIYVVFFAALVFSALRMSYENEKIKVDNQKNEIERAHQNITDSITYAEHIQKAILQKDEKIALFFKQYYVFLKPKDVIGGDFYLLIQHPSDKNISFVIVADCSRHGVPGHFVNFGHIIFKRNNSTKSRYESCQNA